MAHGDHSNQPHHAYDGKSHHHILPEKMALGIFALLLVLTAVTIGVSRVDLGVLNFPVAMLIATIKALLVALFFMGLLYDRAENSLIFSTSFIFLAIFITFTATDIFFRGDVYLKSGALTSAGSSTHSKLKSPWISTPELVAHGKELFSQQCITCHGPEGLGNGPAAAGYKPPPRNFHATTGWDNGRKPSNIFKTLKEGVAGTGMASFATLPVDDRWALAAYVVTFNPEKPEPDTQADLSKIGYDLATGLQTGGAAEEERTMPVDMAIDRMAIPERAPFSASLLAGMPAPDSSTPGGHLYQARCVECHGDHGEGGMRIRALGGYPKAYLTTAPLLASLDTIKSSENFNSLVVNGLPGSSMPGEADLSGAELSELYTYVKQLSSRLPAR